MAPLRCLLFSSKAETVPPIWQVLADLGIEGEHCSSAVDAVERVTTQQFQIVITDWEDQPEAAFLLKTARELKAAQRPLTLAIVTDESILPQALQAGANSILLKPIRPEQVRETIGTACELLRSKSPSAHESAAIALAAAAAGGSMASTSTVSTAARTVTSVVQSSGTVASSAQSEAALHVSEEPVSRGRATASSESAGSAVEDSPSQTKSEVLTGWSMLQARLTSSAPPSPGQKSSERSSERSELLSYGDPSYRDPVDSPGKEYKAPDQTEPRPETESEAALFSYISRKPAERSAKRQTASPNLGKFLVAAAVVAVCIALGAVPGTRHSLRTAYQSVVRVGNRLLNPPPAPMPQTVVAHESFGQSSDDYKLPAATNIPDATTDPSQIRVLPVIDPTAKPSKNPEVNGGVEQTMPSPDGATTESNPAVPGAASPESSPDAPAKDSSPVNVTNSPATPRDPLPEVDPSRTLPAQTHRPAAPQPSLPVPAARPIASGSASGNSGIPSSLRSQIGSSVPQNSGSRPMEAAMSSIEPVNLPEIVARQFLLQPVDPVYPAAAKAAAQRGSVALQVLIGRDGMVQDAKFLQGSLVFARAAIDAVKQWRFKPYVLNGRPVSVQSVMTLNFKPSA